MPVLDTTFVATIANGQTTSPQVDMMEHVLCGIFLPAAFTGTALTFLASDVTGGTFVSVRDGDGAAITKTVAAGQYAPVDPADFAGIRFLKVVSNAAEGGARTLKLAGRLL